MVNPKHSSFICLLRETERTVLCDVRRKPGETVRSVKHTIMEEYKNKRYWREKPDFSVHKNIGMSIVSNYSVILQVLQGVGGVLYTKTRK